MDLHTKGLEESFVYEISDLYLIGIQYSTLIYKLINTFYLLKNSQTQPPVLVTAYVTV